MPRNVTVTFEDGTSHVYQNAPDDLTPEQAQARAVKDFSKRVVHLDGGRPAAPQQPAVPEERGVTGYLGDLGAAFGAGAGQAVAFPGQLLRLATKETEAGPIEQLGKRATEYWEAKKSETQRAKERAVEEKVNAAEEAGAGVLGQAGVAFGEVITDPALLSTYIAQSLPQVIGGSLVGIGVKGGTKLAARQVAAGAAKESVEQFATKAGVSAAVATAALMQGTDVGADTFDEAVAILKKQGYSEEDAKVKAIELGRKAATNATLASLAAQMLPGGRTIESALVRGGLGKGVISGAVKAGLIETPSEGLEEGSGAFFKNLALSEVDPTRRLSQGVGLQTGVGAAAGAGQGVVIGGIGGRRGATAEPKVSPKAEAAPEAKGKRSVEEAAIDALDQETVGERAVEEANQKFEEAALEDQQQPPMGGAAALEGTEQRTTGGAGVGVSVPQPPTEAPAATGAGVGRLAPTEGLAGEAVSREGQPAGALTDEQIDNLANAGFTATEIESAAGLVGVLRSERAEFADVLFIPVARDHAAGLTSEEIAKKNKIDTDFAQRLQVGLGLVPNERAKAAEAPAVETPAKPGTVRVYHSGVVGEGESGRWVSTDKTYAANYRPDLPLYYADIPADDPRLNNPDYANQGVGQGFTFNFELTPQEATTLKEIKRETPAAETPAAETPAAETPTAETPTAKTPAQDRFSDWQVITQEDDPNPFPEGMEFAVSAGAAGTLEFFKTKKEADNWLRQEIEFQKTLTPTAETPAAETPAAETPAGPLDIAKRQPRETTKQNIKLLEHITMTDGSSYVIEQRNNDEWHLVGVPDENESYLGSTRGEAEQALRDDKNSGRLDKIADKIEYFSIEPSPALGGVSEETAQRTPSLKRIVDRLRKLWQAGKITGDEFAGQVNIAASSIENLKIGKPLKKRVRGADYIRERLLNAKREGALSSEAVALAEWFISQNEALVDDLAISIRQPSERGESGASGDYNAFMRLMRLIKGAASDTTAVHEILHHLERMMPENIRSGIRREHAKQTYNAYKKAKADGNANLVKFFEHVLDFNFGDPTGIGGVESSLRAAIKLIKDGAVPYSFYQYVNPSEFWAVNGTRIVEGKYAAIRGTTLTRLRNWLRNLAQKIKSAFGFSSDAPILRALDSLSKADGKFVTENMLFEETGAPPGRGILQSQEQDSIDVDGETRPLLNSRGQRIHPTDEGVRNFWRGFGDSKVVDEEGRPLVMYTGTSKDKDFSSFSVPKNGAWFTADSKEASQYAVENDSMDLVYTEGKYRPVNTASRVIPAYLSIRNPYRMTKTDFDKINKEGYKRAQGQFFDMLRFRGYDGVDMGGGIWVVLKSPTQVKSAVGNTGAFSPTEKKILATQGQEPTVLGLHPTVSQALRAGDLNGMLKAIANTTSGFYADLARRLAELNLPTIISTGTARARQLTRASIDLVSAPQQNRLFSYVQLTYPDLYNKYFQNYDAEANLERVYAGLKELKKILPETNRVSAEFSDVLQAYNDNIESIDPRTLGFYSSDFDEANIDIDRKGGTSNYVLLHEITHAATEMLITRYENEPETLTAEQRAAAKKLKELYKYTKDNYPGDPETYGLRNIYEFVAEAFTNRGFQTKLKDMTYDLVRPVSVWSRFVKSILDLFGINTVAANVMMEANKLFSADRPRARKSIGPMFAKKQKNGPVSGGWRTAYDHNTSLIKLFQDAIKGRVPLDTALKKFAPVAWRTGAYKARQAYFGIAPLRELAKDTKSKFPQLTGAIKLVEQMVAYRGRKMKIAEDIVKDWGKLQSERVQQSTLLGRVMLSATLQSQDPDTGNGSAALLQAWNALSPEAQSIYRRVRDFYANSVKEMIAEMKARARANMANDPAALKKALSDIDALFKGIKGPYFPLRRFGSFWFQVGTTDNNKEFYTFESMADRDFAMNERLEELQNGTKAEKELAETYDLGNRIGEIFDQNKDPTGVLGRVEDLIDGLTATNPADVKKELKDSLHQLMYVLLPQQSMKKMFINRKGIQGASADMLRVFSDSAVHSAYQQARFKYSQDFLNNLTNAKDYIKELQKAGLITPRQRAVYDEYIAEVGERSGVILSTEDKRFSARLAATVNQTTFFWLLTAPATVILNVIGGTTFGVANMGSEFGYAKTTALLTKNLAKYAASVPTRTIKPMLGKQFLAVDFPSIVEGGNLSPLQSMFAKAFIDSSDINISLTNALFELTEQPSALYTGRANTIKKFASGLFHQGERFIREMVLMTSAELAYDKFLNEPIKDANGIIQRDTSGKPLMRTRDVTGFSQQAFDDALEKARDVAGTTLGDFSRAMKPRALQSPLGSVIFSMKSFAITALFHLVRNTYLSLNRPFQSDELADMRAALLAQKIAPDVVDQRIKEAQAELKASYSEARKRLAGVMGITFLFGGLQAQPFFSLLLPALVAALKPDDEEEDEFFNNENWFRNYMEINLGGYLGEMAMKLGMEEKTAKKVGREMGEAISGGIPAAAGVALTERVSIDPKDLWYRSGRYSPDYRETVMETIIANAGPAAGLTMNMFEAAQLMEEGKYQRAFERALPAIVSNPLKTVRLGKEGAVTRSGYTQVEEFTATELAMQALGFQPEVLAQKQKAAMEATTVKIQIQDRRNGVLDRLYLERNSEKGYEYALQMVDEYNKKYPYYPIKPKDIADSFKRKAKAAAEAHGIGMVMPKKMRGRLERMVEYAKDEDED